MMAAAQAHRTLENFVDTFAGDERAMAGASLLLAEELYNLANEHFGPRSASCLIDIAVERALERSAPKGLKVVR